MKPILCIDIGGTSVKYGITEESGRFLVRGSLPTVIREKGADAFLKSLLDLSEKMGNTCQLNGIAVSMAGVVNAETGQLLRPSQYFPGLQQINLAEVLQNKTGLPVTVENDVNCAALAEYHLGAGRGSRNLFCMTLGTGIGGAFVIDGKLYRGSSYAAGEVGQAKMGTSETWENWASVSALLEKAATIRHCLPGQLTGQKFFALVQEGDPDMQTLLREMVRRWAVGIASICWIFNPDRVVIGGGISAQRKILEPLLREALHKEMPPLLVPVTRFSFAELGNDAGMLGAACYFRTRCLSVSDK